MKLNFQEDTSKQILAQKEVIRCGGEQTIESILEYSSIENDEPGIFLLDEIQRFRTIDSTGLEILDTPYQDLWTLLSDGKFSSSGQKKDRLMCMYFDALFDEDQHRSEEEEKSKEKDEEKKEEEKKKKKQTKFKQNVWRAKYLKKTLKLKETVLEIMRWDSRKRLTLLKNSLEQISLFEGESFSKLLIFISGNLDEAYYMADRNADADIDADIFHERSKNIKVTNIKDALGKRFKPEQIARFGNTHIIYPSLSKKNYRKIIRNNIRKTIVAIQKQHNIKISFDKTVYEFIYRNGVYPSQGVRPVLSTISSVIDNSIPTFIMFCLRQNVKEVKVVYKNSYLLAEINGIIEKYETIGDIDDIKKGHGLDQKASIATHEAAHAVVYAISFSLVPSQIVASCSLPDTGGYIGCHTFSESSNYIKRHLQVLLAGRVGEEMIFGEELVTSGAASDLAQATKLASKYYRVFGMGNTLSKKMNKYTTQAPQFNSDFDEANTTIESLLQNEKKVVVETLKNHKPFFMTVAKELYRNGKISSIDFQKMGVKFGFKFEIVNTQRPIYENFASLLEGPKEEQEQIPRAASSNPK
ncbi:MAG: hypothetical protein ACTSSP_01795 [Candidatus Asgardarchaeia archaeon]